MPATISIVVHGGTAILLDALGKCGVKMVVQASTRSVFGQRTNNGTILHETAEDIQLEIILAIELLAHLSLVE